MGEASHMRISAPARTPAGFGLLAAASVVPFASAREALGVEYESAGCGSSSPWPAQCGSSDVKPVRGGPDLVRGDPFVVLDSFSCFYRDDAQQIAVTRMALGAGAAVEAALWTGDADNHPNFNEDAVVLSATALSVGDALGVLQQQIGVGSPAGGIIHLPRGAAACLACCYAVRDGNVLRDLLGNAYALGAGYPVGGSVGGVALPAGASFWAVATGPVMVRRGAVVTAPATGTAFDVTTNQATVIAEQMHVVTVECGVWAVPVSGCADLSVAGTRQVAPPQPQVSFGEGGR